MSTGMSFVPGDVVRVSYQYSDPIPLWDEGTMSGEAHYANVGLVVFVERLTVWYKAERVCVLFDSALGWSDSEFFELVP